MTSYPKQARDIAKICVELVDDGPYGAPEEPLLAMLDGDENRDTRLHDWWNSDPQTRREVYLKLDEAYGINEQYADRKANREGIAGFEYTGGRFPDPEDVNDKARIKFYYGVYDVMLDLVEEEAQKKFDSED